MNIPSPRIPVFDFAILFNLPAYKIVIDLSPSIINSPTGISVEITTIKPNGDKLLATPFTAANLASVYEVPLPLMGQEIMWGYYRITARLLIDGVQAGIIEKKFNLCTSKGPGNGNGNAGGLKIDVDCQRGKIRLSGLSGYTYKGVEAEREEKNVTFYFPSVIEKLPIKGIVNLPVEIDGYTGRSTAKGSNISTYVFDQLITVSVKYTDEVERNVRCGYDLNKIHCALESVTLKASAQELCDLSCRISPLLFLVTMGLQLGKDVDKYITEIEDILGADCGCCSSDGEKLSTIISYCPGVTNLRAMLTNTTLAAMFDSKDLAASTNLRVRYRQVGVTAWTDYATAIVPTYAINQSVQFEVPLANNQYEVSVTATCCDGSIGDDVKVKTALPSGATCPTIQDAEAEGYSTTESDPITFYWAWSAVNPYLSPETSNGGAAPAWQSGTFLTGQPLIADFHLMPDFSYPLLKVPVDEPVRNFFEDSGSVFNTDVIPGDVFRAPFGNSGEFVYYTTYEPYSFSHTAAGGTPKVTFSIK